MHRSFFFLALAAALGLCACANGPTASAGGSSAAAGPYQYVSPDSPFAQDWAVIAPP